MPKRTIAAFLSVLLVLTLSLGSTVAYLQDEDHAVNVMTLGEVYIEQHEYQRDNAEAKDAVALLDFENGEPHPLYPAVYAEEGEKAFNWAANTPINDAATEKKIGETNIWNPDLINNEVDKIVTVENTGKSEAYVRTWFAFQSGDLSMDDWKEMVHINTNTTDWDWDWDNNTNWGIVEIDGVNYVVGVVYYIANEGKLAKGATTPASLIQVALDNDATNETMQKLNAADPDSQEYKILVYTQAIQTQGFADAVTALSEGFMPGIYENHPFDGINTKTNGWDGTADTSWYDDAKSEFMIMTAEQLAGFAELVDGGNTFEGKTVKVGKNIDLYHMAEGANDPTCFDPIGSYRNDNAFKGTFDGQNYTIKNMSQNTWALDTGYYYGDLGLGLFGKVEDATIKNLVMDNASISGESAICGTVAAAAYGECTFENITVKNSEVNDYQYYAGGIVGWASGEHVYKDCNVDESTTVGSQWGDFGNANGGMIGGIGSSAEILFEDCTVACRIDATNDVVSAYQWYNYRNSGMLIGRVPQEITNGEVQTVKTPENVTCKNVTVIYDDWANYTYCEFAGTGYPFVRVQEGVSVDAYSNVRYGHPTDAKGNTVVDDNHEHNDGEAHHELIAFDQLFGGPAEHRYCYYGIAEYDGVDVVYNNK